MLGAKLIHLKIGELHIKVLLLLRWH